MYNTEYVFSNQLKHDYLTEIDGYYSDNNYITVAICLNRLDKFEAKIDKDVMYFNIEDFMYFFEDLKTPSYATLQSYKSIIFKYLLYASNITKINTGIIAIDNVPLGELKDAVNTRAMNDRMLTEDEYVKILEMRDIEIQVKAQVVLAWNGVVGKDNEDMKMAKSTDYNHEEKTLTINDKEYKLMDIEADIINKACTETTSQYTGTDGELKERDLLDSIYILKPYAHFRLKSNTPISTAILKRRFVELAMQLGRPKLTTKAYTTSGYIYRMLEDNNFVEMEFGQMTKWLEERDITHTRSQLNEQQKLMLKKIRGNKEDDGE